MYALSTGIFIFPGFWPRDANNRCNFCHPRRSGDKKALTSHASCRLTRPAYYGPYTAGSLFFLDALRLPSLSVAFLSRDFRLSQL